MKDGNRDAGLYAGHINKQWVRLLDLLGMNVHYTRCRGTRLWTDEGESYLDFLSGYCVQNLGHNHPHLARALKEEIDHAGPMILQSLVPGLAGILAHKLCSLTGGGLNKVYFSNTGSEGVETVIKFARLHTKRSGILYSEGAFHGISYGAMSLMQHTPWVDNFGPFLPGTEGIPFLDLPILEERLKTKKFAAFITEVIQSEAGIKMAPPEAFKAARELCCRHGTLFVADEVQSGIFRTGKFLASHHMGIEPDMVILAKALGGGMLPAGAVLMKDAINHSVYKSLDRAFSNASTFGENTLAMRAGITTLEIIENQGLAENCVKMGALLRERVGALIPRYEMLKEIRGRGLMNGVEFVPPKSLKLKVLFEAFQALHPGLFGQMIVMKMFREGKVLTQVCGNNYRVIKACPALIAGEEDIDFFVDALDRTMRSFHSGKGFAEGLKIGKRALGL